MIRALILALAAGPLAGQIVIDTFAGGRIRSGVPAQVVSLASVDGITWDPAGNLVFCETENHVIRRVRADGTIETIAGTGEPGFSGDGGAATAARLNLPTALAYDAAGNLYFADSGNRRIRKIDTSGEIRTVAGNGIPYPEGNLEGTATELSFGGVADLAIDSAGNIYLSDALPVIRRITPAGRVEIYAGTLNCGDCPAGDEGPAKQARLTLEGSPLAVDGSGNLYFVDGTSGLAGMRVRRISTDGIIHAFPGTGEATYYRIASMTTDAAGNVYLAEAPGPLDPERLVRISAGGTITTIAGGAGSSFTPDGDATNASINPLSLAANGRGDVAFEEGKGTQVTVREVTAQSMLRTIAGGTPQPAPDGMMARDAWLLRPHSIAVGRTGDVYVVEGQGCLVRKIGTDGALRTLAGSGQCAVGPWTGPDPRADLTPLAVAVDSQNQVYVSDVYGKLYVITPDGSMSVAATPAATPTMNIAIDSQDWVYSLGDLSLVRFRPGGDAQTIVAPPPSPVSPPPGFGPTALNGFGIDASGNLYFSGGYAGQTGIITFRINADGSYTPISQLPDATAWFSSSMASQWFTSAAELSFVNAQGTWSLGRGTSVGNLGDGGPAQSAHFGALALAFGPAGELYIIDGARIRKLSGAGPQSAPAITPGGVVNSASYTGGAIAPGELVSIFGSNFGTADLEINAAENNMIPTTLGRTKVLFDGVPGVITAATPNQINAVVPNVWWFTPGASVAIRVQVDATLSAPVTAPVAESAFGLYTSDWSSGQGAIINQDGTPNSSANPAAPGTYVSLYGTGAGTMSPELLDGALTLLTPYPVPVSPVTVRIGGKTAEIQYRGGAPTLVNGVVQINAKIPDGVGPGSVPVEVTVGNGPTSRAVNVAVQ